MYISFLFDCYHLSLEGVLFVCLFISACFYGIRKINYVMICLCFNVKTNSHIMMVIILDMLYGS